MTVDERSSAASGSPFFSKIHGYGPSYSSGSTPLTSRRLKRRMDRETMNSDEFVEPQPKRKVYEEKMSNKLWNFHIDDVMQHMNNREENRPVIEELDGDWLQDDIELDNFGNEPLIEEPSTSTFDDSYSNSAGELILSDKLRNYLESCNNYNEHRLFKPTKTGKEVTLYRQPSTISAPDENSDMSGRIQELQNWDDEELDEDHEQIVSFPGSQDSSPLSSPISVQRKRSMSPSFLDQSRSEIGGPGTSTSNTEDENNEMEID